MPERPLPATGEPIDLGGGYTVRSGTISGSVNSTDGRGGGARALVGSDLDALLEATGLTQDRILVITPEDAATAGARALDAPAAQPAVTIDVPRAPGMLAVLLVEDELGALSWQFPDGHSTIDPDASAARALVPGARFTVSMRRAPSAPGTAGARGLLDLGRKIVKVFLFPITDALLGPIVRGFASRWEAANRPYLARGYTPDNYKEDRKDFPPLQDADWRRLAGGRALLWVHGTFSSCGAFAAIAPEVMIQLCDAYGGRSFALNHCTMSADPMENALELLRRIPAGVDLDVDVVCHSRGGLVSREVARLGPNGAGGGTLRVGRIVLVGVPNEGTALADDDHMADMIDRLTTVAKLVPAPAVQKVVEGVVLALKVLGHGFLHDLSGLRAMNPHGPFLPQINVPNAGAPEYYAIASDFDPPPGTPLFSLARVENGAADKVFGGMANDLVVPRDGVFARNGAKGFPVPDEHCFKFAPADGVIHTEYFSQARTQNLLLQWLQPSAPGARAFAARAARAARPARPAEARTFTPAELSALRPHVIDLSEGKFRDSGSYYTPPTDVDAIFEQCIPAWRQQRPAGEPLRLVFYAHGGLVGEQEGLGIAQKHAEWWKRNGVYPVYFVWETGLFDAVRSILESVAGRIPGIAARDLWDYTTDPLVEAGCRTLGGVKVWGAMKSNAQLASATGGGARYVAQKLAAFCETEREDHRDVELHAVGHSAGAIFHAHFIPCAIEAGVPSFRTLQLLAPAIRVDEFKQRLQPHIGAGAEQLTMYTMLRHFEEADDCIGVYRKSLLYLIHNALEAEQDAPILGLEMSTRGDADVKRLFGLDGSAHPAADVVWSETGASTGQSASRSTSHGGFDDDAATMSSVAARVLGAPAAPVPYAGEPSRALGQWPIATSWLEPFDLTGVGMGAPFAAPPSSPLPPAMEPSRQDSKPTAAPASAVGGRRIALCVGIDQYAAPNTLAGCVNDANDWGRTLASLGFDVSYLRDAEATYTAITERLRAMISAAHPGDVLVFQYSGHGTEVPDVDGDEGAGPDQAFVPVDFDSGAFLIDDDVRAILVGLPKGVSMSVFADCCHSATITRMLGRTPPAAPAGSRARFIVPTPQQIQAHRRFRESLRKRGLARDVSDRTAMTWVNFSACQKHEYAYENDGHGAFTVNAIALLRQGIAGLTNIVFQQRVTASFGTDRVQTPYLDCAPGAENDPLLVGTTVASRDASVSIPAGTRPFSLEHGVTRSRHVDIAGGLRTYADRLASDGDG